MSSFFPMASSSSAPPPRRTWKYDVFPSFSGEDVRKTFLSHLLKELRSKLNSFIDNDMERGRSIGPELKSAIRDSRILIVVFSENYASSTWCLDELVEIHNCFKELDQMVIPVFYNVDPSDVRKQTGKFGDIFKETCKKKTEDQETCKDKTEDQKQSWIQALTDVANITGYDSLNRKWENEAELTEQISKDVLNKLFTTLDDFRDFVGIDAHLERLNSMLCFDSGGVKMVGIVGTSGIGKSTIARALFSRRKSQFEHQAFVFYKRSIEDKKVPGIGVQVSWVNQFLSDILGIKDIKNDSLGAVKERLKHKKVLVVLDDVDEIELLDTLVGETGWFGLGSRIIVVTQDIALLNSHGIDLIYEVQLPSQEVALEMFCRSAFRRKSRDDFMELAVKVAELAGNHPLSLNVLGSLLRGKDKKEWEEMMPRIQGGLDDKIGKILKVCYDRLDSKEDQELFLYIACLFKGESFSYINNLLEGVYTSVKTRIRMLADKSLIRITTPEETVQMHTLLQKLGRQIVRQESTNSPGKRRFLVDVEDIHDVLKNKTGTENVLGICLNASDVDTNKPLLIDENSFKGMCNLQFIKFYYGGRWCQQDRDEVKLKSPQGLIYLPPKLRLLHWERYPGKYIPSNFEAECLVELIMKSSKLERLWEGTSPLQHLKTMDLNGSENLKKIPNLSKAKNLKVLNLLGCSELMVLPEEVNFESLEHLHLTQCSWLKSFPRSRTSNAFLLIENTHRLTHLSWERCLLRCMPSNFCTEHLVEIYMPYSKFEKLWEGVKPLQNLVSVNIISSKDLKEIPDLSKATKLKKLDMRRCKSLEVLPTDINLESLEELHLNECSRLRSFPQISTSIKKLYLWNTAIEEVPSWIENMSNLEILYMWDCKRLKNISASIFKLRHLKEAVFRSCSELTSFSDASVVATAARITDFLDLPSDNLKLFRFNGCWRLDGNAQELILGLSLPMITVLPGEEVPTYFTHRSSCGNSVIINLPQSSPSHQVLRFKACILLGSSEDYISTLKIHWRVRGFNGVKLFDLEFVAWSHHVVVLNFELSDFELNSHLRSAPIEEHKSGQCELDYNDMEFDFLLFDYGREIYDIKGCGIRLLDAESGRSKKQMQMTETTSEEPSNSLNGQIIAELSLLQGEASSTSNITPSSVSYTNNFHGDDGASTST